MGKSLLDPIKPQKGAVDILIHFEKVLYHFQNGRKQTLILLNSCKIVLIKRRKYLKRDQNHLRSLLKWIKIIFRSLLKWIKLISKQLFSSFKRFRYFNEKIRYQFYVWFKLWTSKFLCHFESGSNWFFLSGSKCI